MVNGSRSSKVVAAAFVVSFMAAGAIASQPAVAQVTGSNVAIEATQDRDTLWIETTVPEGDADEVKIVIRAPKLRAQGTVKWQVCRFPSTGAGTYRCGIDVSDGSLAKSRSGMWKANVLVDRELQAAERFSL